MLKIDWQYNNCYPCNLCDPMEHGFSDFIGDFVLCFYFQSLLVSLHCLSLKSHADINGSLSVGIYQIWFTELQV